MIKRALIGMLGLVLAAGVGAIQAQVPGQRDPAPAAASGEVRGIIVDGQGGEPIAGASVAVHSRADASLVTGAVVREDGAFRIEGLQPGIYYLQVTSIGYTSKTTDDITIAAGSPTANMGPVRMARAPVSAEGIEVTVERPTVMIEPDRNSYVAKDVAPAATTASQILEAVPSVQVDADGKVSLRGNENVAIQINGRPAPVRGDQLNAYLQQLPANVIDRVEVIPTPSARHDPEGMAGIINIVMKQNIDLGMSGGFTLSGATAERYNAGGNLGYQRGPFTLFTTYGFNWDGRSVEGINDRERFDALRHPLSFTEQDISGETSRNGHNLTTTLDYSLGERDVVSSSLTINRRTSSDFSLAAITELDAESAPTDRYDRPRDADNQGLLFDTTLAFKRTFEPRRHELTTELRFNRAKDEDLTLLWRQSPPGETDSPSQLEIESNDVDALTRQLTSQVDYIRMLSPSTKLETGYKGTTRWLEREYLVLKDPLGTGDWVESDLSNAFDFDERVHAAYAVLSHTIGQVDLQAGLRAEHASRDFTLADQAQSYPHDYGSIFPSGIASYALNDASKVKISYSRRIRRPGTQELNPFPVFFDAQNVFIGNPDLNPEYTDAIELGYERSGEWGSFQLSPFYRRTTDVIRFIVNPTDVIDGREVTSVSFENLATGNSWGTDVNASLQFSKRVSGLASFNIFKMVTEGGSESSLSSNAVTWSTRLNGTIQLTPTLTLQAMHLYRAPMEFERGRFSSWKMTSVTLRQKLYGEKASLSLRFTDPFNTMGFRVEAGDDDVFQITERKFDARAVHLTFQYNFGQAPKVRQPRPEPTQEPQAGFPQ
jgi:ferric enterobactin receptor